VSGFVDDTNLLSDGLETVATCRLREDAWDSYQDWARRYGMGFAPEKNEPMHFTRARDPLL
jgi:hypothetical protein